MKRLIRFPSIEQYRTVVKLVRDRAKWHSIPAPKIEFEGSVKLHGTNASICVSGPDFWCQSRENIISFDRDNAGFATYVTRNQEFYSAFMKLVQDFSPVSLTPDSIVSVYGEWCGAGIQKGVAISSLEKMFVVFGIRVFDGVGDEDSTSTWYSSELLKQIAVAAFDVNDLMLMGRVKDPLPTNLHFITSFPTWTRIVDFNDPEALQNELDDLTIAVEAECPVGKHFGVSGVGEGIVWKAVSGPEGFNLSGLTFKVKGEKHSVSKVRVLASFDVEKHNSIKALIESIVTEARLEQGITDGLLQLGLTTEVKNTGAFLKWVGGDVIKEESDTIIKNGFEKKDVMGEVNRVARQWFLTKIQ